MTIDDIDELAERLIRLEWPFYDQAIPGIRERIVGVKERFKTQLIYFLIQKSIEILPKEV